MLNPSRIHDHALGMEYRIEIRQSGLDHAARWLDSRTECLDQSEQGGGLLARKSRETKSFSVAIDVDRARPLHAGDVGQRDRLAAANRSPIGVSELMQEVKPATGMSRINENRLAAIDQGRQRPGIVCVRDRGDYQHDQIGAANGFGDIRRQEIDWDQPLLNATRLNATLRAQS